MHAWRRTAAVRSISRGTWPANRQRGSCQEEPTNRPQLPQRELAKRSNACRIGCCRQDDSRTGHARGNEGDHRRRLCARGPGHVLDYNLRKQAHHDEHQLKLAEFAKTTIVAKSGQSIAPTARGAVEQAMEVENRQIRSSISDEYEGPFSRFVKLARRKNRHARGQWLLVAVEKRDCLGLYLRLSTSDLAIAFAVAQSAAPTLTTRSPAD
jgi:hypothetical protein